MVFYGARLKTMAAWQWVTAVAVAFGIAGGVMIWRRRQTRGRVREPWVLRQALFVVAIGAAGAAAAFVLSYRATAGADKDRFDVAIIAAIAAAALAAGMLTWGRLELSRQEHRLGLDQDLTERYGRAVEQLGSDEELIRVGGVFALERFALDAARTPNSNDVDWRMALGMLAALARRDSQSAVDSELATAAGLHKETNSGAATSVLEAVQALGRFTQRSGRRLVSGEGPNLSGVVTPGANLASAELPGAVLTDADLTGANLTGADLTDANLSRANFHRADLTSADVTGADLTDADLTDADLDAAHLTGATLTDANLTDTYLADVDLEAADLGGANLTNADLTGANLTGANLTDANLTGANLTGAVLAGAVLSGANLTALTYGSVGRAENSTRWPEGFDPPPSGNPHM